MPSPFPGMDPYLEMPGHWPSFHTTFLVDLKRALLPHVAPAYFIDVNHELYLQREEDDGRQLFAKADVGVAERRRAAAATAGAVAAPLTGRIPVPGGRRLTRRRLTIRDRQRRRVVTVVELLSPTDKRLGPDRDKYLAKRERILGSSASLVEIDLLRGGHRMPFEGRPACDYCAVVSRAVERPAAGLWVWGVRDQLPAIPFPLRPGEPEPVVSLREVLDVSYDTSRLDLDLYDDPLDPSLSASDSAWATGVLKPPPRGRKRSAT